jgi:hypothetical protein
VRTLLATLLLAAGTAVPLAAQEEGAPEPWRDSFYPIVRYSGNDGASIGIRYTWFKRAPYEAPYFQAAAITGDVAYSVSGSYGASVRFKAPGLRRNWRFDAGVGAIKQARYEFYGVGEETDYSPDSVTDARSYYYRVRRAQVQVRGEASRRITGRLWVTGMALWKRTNFTDLPGGSVFTDEFGSEKLETDAIGRIGLAWDSRDNDYDTHRGALLEAGLLRGTFGGGYGRWVAEARGWLPFGTWESTWVSARVLAAARTDGELPLDAKLYVPTWEGQARVLGGAESHRGFLDQRFVGRDLLVSNLAVHHDLVNGGIFAAGVIAFMDAGRVFEESDFTLTTEGMKVGGGGGLYLRLLQTGIYTFNFATGPDGFVFTLGNNWMF